MAEIYSGIMGIAELAWVTTAFNEVTCASPLMLAVLLFMALAARSRSSLALPMVALPYIGQVNSLPIYV